LLPLILFVAGFVSDYKNAMDELKPLILHILNTIIEELDIPQMLKRGIMTPVLKKNKDRQNPANYREGLIVIIHRYLCWILLSPLML
jgi:hypothetical protein